MEQIALLRRQLSEASSGRAAAEGSLAEAEAREAAHRHRQGELQTSLQVMVLADKVACPNPDLYPFLKHTFALTSLTTSPPHCRRWRRKKMRRGS